MKDLIFYLIENEVISKRDLYEGGIRVPMIARWPGKIEPGTETNLVSAFWDVMPTFAEIAGAATPENIDGISFLPTLLGQQGQIVHEHLYWEFYAQGGKQAVRKGNWKAVRLNCFDSTKTTVELYDLDKDREETIKLDEEFPDIVIDMVNIMDIINIGDIIVIVIINIIGRVQILMKIQ